MTCISRALGLNCLARGCFQLQRYGLRSRTHFSGEGPELEEKRRQHCFGVVRRAQLVLRFSVEHTKRGVLPGSFQTTERVGAALETKTTCQVLASLYVVSGYE